MFFGALCLNHKEVCLFWQVYSWDFCVCQQFSSALILERRSTVCVNGKLWGMCARAQVIGLSKDCHVSTSENVIMEVFMQNKGWKSEYLRTASVTLGEVSFCYGMQKISTCANIRGRTIRSVWNKRKTFAKLSMTFALLPLWSVPERLVIESTKINC